MSSETWQEIWGLLALSPWIAFVVAIVWFKVLDLRDNVRAAPTSERARRPEKRVDRRTSTNP